MTHSGRVIHHAVGCACTLCVRCALNDEDGRTAIMIAARYGHLWVVAALIAAGANINIAVSNSGRTALMIAAKYGHLTIVAALIAAGADVNAADATGATPPTGAGRRCWRQVQT